MSDMYDIQFDPLKGRLTITPRGFWSSTIAEQFAADVLTRAAVIRGRNGRVASLIDLRQVPIQQSGVISALKKLVVKASLITSSPIAAVVGSTLAKLQFQRAFVSSNCRVFLDIDAADEWLAIEQAPK